jgi:23S rRNA pseudouridine1911/1915/1917 synthase
MKENDKYSLLLVNIDSGKKNQIRVAMNDMGHPIIGDDKYGSPTNPINRLGLHASKLVLKNPMNDKIYEFKASIPKDFDKLF